MKLAHASATLLIAFAGSADAEPRLDLKKIMASVDGEYLSYSGTFGSRRVVNAESRIDTGSTLVSLGISQGSRKAGGDSFKATRLTAAVVHDWSSRLSTRTS